MARSIMIQGTMSNAGKSLIAAGLCRIFAQDGYKTAPFKSQNMALNSFITEDGLEMGRAQVVQAEAAGVKPSAYMNPILLKPTTDVGSQVIVNGVSIGNMRAKDYFAYKKQLIPQIMEAYKHLDEEYDVIVIEGAGSPAEINLKSDDIVNMGLAAMVDAPVLLAGDIDRGGVFAQLYGTVELLEPEERNRIKGLIINKFRGDKTILEPGLRQLEDLCRIPVAGVVPYMNVDIEDEDSLSTKLGNTRQKGCIDIAVLRFPKISNFTDMDAFERMNEVSIRYVSKPSELKQPDMVILDVMMPGMDGFATLKELRKISKIPVLMLTARGEAEDKFAGFENGADDYLLKPFLPKELLFRVQAILKRAYPGKDRKVFFDTATVDLEKAMVQRNGESISLTAKEFQLFEKLYENAGRIVTTGALCQAICGDFWQGYESTLATHIRHLREKIEENPSEPKYVHTKWGVGYYFQA